MVNSAGKVLDWVFMFDDNKGVLAFLDHAQSGSPVSRREETVPRRARAKFPGQKLADIEDNGKVMPIVEGHPRESCPAKPRVQQDHHRAHGYLAGRLDNDGKPVADTVRQENYVEDRFNVPVVKQEAAQLAPPPASARTLKIADSLARVLASHAFMGELDVNPFGDVNGSKGLRADCSFWGQKVQTDGNGPARVHIDGKSEAAAVALRQPKAAAAPLWQHQVRKLAWEGLIEMNGNRITRLLLVAHGTDMLKRGNKKAELGQLPGGHIAFIDLDCGVRYGIIGEPVLAEKAGSADEIPDQARKQLVEVLGGAFVVYRDKVQEELKLSEEQKGKLLQTFPDHLHETKKVFEKVKDLKSAEREKEMQEHRQKSDQKLSALLKEVLDAKQLERLSQLQLQQAGAFVLLGRNEAFRKLKITDEQRQRFMAVVQEMQKKIEPLIKEAQSGGDPQEIRPKIMKIRKDHEGKIEALLTDAQKKQWKEMLGKPFDY